LIRIVNRPRTTTLLPCAILLRLEFDDILYLGNFAEELFNPFASLPLSGKRHIFHFGQFPLDISGERVQQRLNITSLLTVIKLLHRMLVLLFVHLFPLTSARSPDLDDETDSLARRPLTRAVRHSPSSRF